MTYSSRGCCHLECAAASHGPSRRRCLRDEPHSGLRRGLSFRHDSRNSRLSRRVQNARDRFGSESIGWHPCNSDDWQPALRPGTLQGAIKRTCVMSLLVTSLSLFPIYCCLVDMSDGITTAAVGDVLSVPFALMTVHINDGAKRVHKLLRPQRSKRHRAFTNTPVWNFRGHLHDELLHSRLREKNHVYAGLIIRMSEFEQRDMQQGSCLLVLFYAFCRISSLRIRSPQPREPFCPWFRLPCLRLQIPLYHVPIYVAVDYIFTCTYIAPDGSRIHTSNMHSPQQYNLDEYSN